LQFRKLETREAVSEHVSTLNASRSWVVLDTETTGLDFRRDRILDVQLSGVEPESAVLFSSDFINELGALKGDMCLVGHNLAFDLKMLHSAGCDLTGFKWRDTMLLHHLIDEEASHSLDSLVQTRWQDSYKDFWDKYDSYEEAPDSERLNYACKDVVYTQRLYCEFLDAGLRPGLVEHVHLLAKSLLSTEIAGIGVDLDYLVKRGQELQEKILTLKPAMRKAACGEVELAEVEAWKEKLDAYKTERGRAGCKRPTFSFDSPKQVSELLYRRLRLPPQHDPKTRSVSVGDLALESLEKAHPLIPLLREYRGHQKVYGSYIEGTLERLSGSRIYPEFRVNGTKTGRISHVNPNMGQLPRAGGIRGIYVPDEGCVFITADYSQLEVVLAAHFSRDEQLLRVGLEGASLHDITAAALGIDRSTAKTINFGIQYGAGVRKIRDILGCGEEAAERALDKYWDTYRGLKRLVDECHAKVNRGEPITNPFGRSRHFPREFPDKWAKERAKRQSFNALIQGTGGDLTSRAFYLADERLRGLGIGKALFTVHDEVVIQARKEHWEKAQAILVSAMEAVGREIELTVPLKAQPSGPCARWED
jgi:DNA polymerase-1